MMSKGGMFDHRRAVLLASAAFAASVSAPAWAQTAPTTDEKVQSDARARNDDAQGADGRDDIVVTGSRIQRDKLTEQLYPTQDLGKADIDNRGFFNIGDAIVNTPIFSSASNTDTDFNQAPQDIGFTFVNLFGLGSERTLTLVNGKRVVSSISPQPTRSVGQSGLQVDIGTIPSALIERVETITVGGAPAYGADAIAGTVNVILRKRFTGLEFNGQAGVSDDGDAGNYRLEGVFGTNFAGGRGNIVVSGEYAKRNGVLFTDRPGANDIQVNDPRLATNPAGFFNIVPQPPINTFQRNTGFPGVSFYGTPTRDLFGFGAPAVFGDTPVGFAQNAQGQVLQFDQTGNLIVTPIGNGNGTFLFTQNQPNYPGLYRQFDYTSLLNDSERYVVASLGRYEFSDHVAAVYRVSYSDLRARQGVGQPILLGAGGAAAPTVQFNNPFLSAQARATLQSATAGFGLPFAAGSSFTLPKTLGEFGTEGPRARSKTFTGTAGLEGDFQIGERKWNWDLTYSYGQTRSTTTSQNVLRTAFNAAIDAVVVDTSGAIVTNPALYAAPSAFTFNGTGYTAANGQRIVCRSSVGSASSTCIPFNLIGQQNPQAAINALAFDSILYSRIKQQFVQANVSGGVFNLPAGEVKVAVGAEYRDERASYSADPVTTVAGGINQTAPISAISGGFKSREGYIETSIPLLSGDMLGFKALNELTFEGSARYIDNNRTGGDWVWTAGGRLSLFDSITFRGNKTRSVRSPAIGQIAGQSPATVGVADPCSVSQIGRGNAAATRRTNCVAAVIAAGRATDTASATTFLSTFTGQPAGVSGTIGGNPNLQTEKADSWTAGVVINPSFFRNFSLAVDWNDIRIKGAIQSLSPAQVVSSCYDSTAYPSQPSCTNFTRNNANFFLNGFTAGFVNTGSIAFAGLTASGRLRIPLPGDRQAISLTGSWFHLDHYREQAVSGLPTEQSNTVGFEKNRFQLQGGYSIAGLTALWTTTYTQGAFLTSDERDGTANVFAIDKTKASWVHDLAILYDVNPNFGIRFIVSNLTESNQPDELKQFASVQARIGRTFAFGVRAKY